LSKQIFWQSFNKIGLQMLPLECKHQMLTDDGRRTSHDARRTTTDDGQPLTTIAHHEHFVLRWAKKTQKRFFFENHKLQQQENKGFRRKKPVYVPLDQSTGESLSQEQNCLILKNLINSNTKYLSDTFIYYRLLHTSQQPLSSHKPDSSVDIAANPFFEKYKQKIKHLKE